MGEASRVAESEGEPRRRGARVEGALALEFPPRRGVRLALAGALIGYPGFGFWLAWALARFVEEAASPSLGTATLAIVAPITLAVSIALPPTLLRMRQPRPASLRWDAWGIAELDGEHVRTAIPWSDAWARVETRGRARLIQVRDGAGRTITAAEPGAIPAWLSNRRASASDLTPLTAQVMDLPTLSAIEPDARDRRRPSSGRAVLTPPILAGVIGTSLLAFHPDLRFLAPAFAALIACALCAVTALRPMHELLELLAAARRFERAEEATIEEGEHDEALIRRKDGTLVRVTLQGTGHPDARLAARTGTTVWVVLPATGWIPARKRRDATAPVPAEAIETAHERQARAELVRAVAIELAVRVAAVFYWFAVSISPVFRT